MYKKIFGVGILLLFVGTCVIASVWYFNREDNKQQAVITYKDPRLTDEEKQTMLNNIKILEEQLLSLTLDDKDGRYKTYIKIGFQYFALGEYSKARESHLKAAETMPENPVPWAELYVVENAMGDYENAKLHIQKAIVLNSYNPDYWRWLIALGEGPLKIDDQKLDQTYRDAIEQTRNNASILALYARFLERKGNISGAIEQYKKAIEQDPSQKILYSKEVELLQAKLK